MKNLNEIEQFFKEKDLISYAQELDFEHPNRTYFKIIDKEFTIKVFTMGSYLRISMITLCKENQKDITITDIDIVRDLFDECLKQWSTKLYNKERAYKKELKKALKEVKFLNNIVKKAGLFFDNPEELNSIALKEVKLKEPQIKHEDAKRCLLKCYYYFINEVQFDSDECQFVFTIDNNTKLVFNCSTMYNLEDIILKINKDNLDITFNLNYDKDCLFFYSCINAINRRRALVDALTIE